MENEDLSRVLVEALEGIKAYFIQQITYNKLLLSKKMTALSAQLTLYIILLFVVSFILLFISFAFANWYAVRFGEIYFGYLIVAAFYLLLGIVFFVFRKPLFFQPLRKLMGDMFFSDDDDSGIDMNTFTSASNLDIEIQKAQLALEMEEEALKEQFDEVGRLYSLPKLVEHFVKNAVQSIATVSNIAKFSYKLVRKLIPNKNKSKKLKD
ncbi:MAG: hypothetical protein KQH67_11260 [Bacteroidetes bacterium]|nr:hypothetical protein [Bacteroidota bacterium]